MGDDIIEIKPNFHGLGVNFNALYKRIIKKQPKISDIQNITMRFVRTFEDHGVATTQIPRLIPQISLDSLKNLPESLIPSLNNKVIDKVVNLFQIRRQWIEGLSVRMYDTLWCYKNPHRFFKDIANLNFKEPFYCPIFAFCQSDKIGYKRFRGQPIVLVLNEKIVDLDDNEINRYRIYMDSWDWGYWKCRIQLKAMVRVLYILKETIVPLYKVSPEILEKIKSGRQVPHSYMIGAKRLQNLSLEDFVLYPNESAVSKESDELVQVENYIDNFDLENFARKILN